MKTTAFGWKTRLDIGLGIWNNFSYILDQFQIVAFLDALFELLLKHFLALHALYIIHIAKSWVIYELKVKYSYMYVYKWKENILMLDNFEVFRQLFFLPPTGGGIFYVSIANTEQFGS